MTCRRRQKKYERAQSTPVPTAQPHASGPSPTERCAINAERIEQAECDDAVGDAMHFGNIDKTDYMIMMHTSRLHRTIHAHAAKSICIGTRIQSGVA
jgi:hypothetical protein